MSRTLHFGRDILDCPDVDLEDLLAMLSPSDIESMVNEMAADPDDKHLPASVRTAYRLFFVEVVFTCGKQVLKQSFQNQL